MNTSYKKGTAAVWTGEGNINTQGAVTTPIVNSVAFAYDDLEEWYDVSKGNKEGFIYSRNTNPTVAALEEKIRVLEGAEAAISFATGMAAISNSLFTFLTAGKKARVCKPLMPSAKSRSKSASKLPYKLVKR